MNNSREACQLNVISDLKSFIADDSTLSCSCAFALEMEIAQQVSETIIVFAAASLLPAEEDCNYYFFSIEQAKL